MDGATGSKLCRRPTSVTCDLPIARWPWHGRYSPGPVLEIRDRTQLAQLIALGRTVGVFPESARAWLWAEAHRRTPDRCAPRRHPHRLARAQPLPRPRRADPNGRTALTLTRVNTRVRATELEHFWRERCEPKDDRGPRGGHGSTCRHVGRWSWRACGCRTALLGGRAAGPSAPTRRTPTPSRQPAVGTGRPGPAGAPVTSAAQ